MSNDIAQQKLDNIDYIPKNGSLCENCIFYETEKCPYDYVCPSLDRLIKFEMEHGEL